MLDRLIFFPDPHVPDPPSGVAERWIETDDGVRLHAWWAEAGDAAPVLVWSHGNGGNIAGRVDVLRALAARGLGVLAYDYRGYGRSAGSPSEPGVTRDARAAFDHLRAAGIAAERIVCFGESLGGAVSIRLATERPAAGVAVVATFTRLQDVARSHYGPLAMLAGDRFDSLARLVDLAVPLFIAHGDRDDVVPFELGERLFAAAREPKSFRRVPGAYHNDVFADAGLLDAIAAFAHGVTSPP